MVEENKSSVIWWEERVYLVIKKGSTYICSRHFISEDYILGCGDSHLKPGAVPSLSNGSLFMSNRRNSDLHGLCRASTPYDQTPSLWRFQICQGLEASSSHSHLSVTFMILNIQVDVTLRKHYLMLAFGEQTLSMFTLHSMCLLVIWN